MSDILDTPTSVMKELNTVIQPSNHSSPLRLPTELLIYVANALDSADMKNESWEYDPLHALRM